MPVALFFACAVLSVTDGDTFRCRDGTRVRLAAIDAPELHGCRSGRKCAPGDPVASRASLTRLAAGRTLRCERTGVSYGRVTAWCKMHGRIDLSCEQFRRGQAVPLVHYERGRRLCV